MNYDSDSTVNMVGVYVWSYGLHVSLSPCYTDRTMERDIACLRERVNTQQAQAALANEPGEDDTRTCKLCFNSTESGTAPTVCDFCGRQACYWCASFTSPKLGATDRIVKVSLPI